MSNPKVIAVLGEEPITLTEAKDNLLFPRDATYEDERIQGLIVSAREYAEEYTGRALVLQKLAWSLDRFPSGLAFLPKPPFVSITADETHTDLGVSYLDSANVSQPLVLDTDYRADTFSEPGRLQTVTGWPAMESRLGGVTITYLAGYLTRSDVPQRVKQAMHLLVKDWFREGDSRISDTVQKRAGSLLRSAWAGTLAGTFG